MAGPDVTRKVASGLFLSGLVRIRFETVGLEQAARVVWPVSMKTDYFVVIVMSYNGLDAVFLANISCHRA